MLLRGLRGLPRQPLRALRSLPRTVQGFTDLPGANALPGVPTLSHVYSRVRRTLGSDESTDILEVTKARPPKTPFNGPISAHRRFAFGSLSLDAVRQIRREFGVTVNDVVVTLCAGAVREWLLERDALPEDPLVAMIPMSVRRRDERGTWGNRISMMVVPIPTNEPDPATRLRKTHELLRSAKERHSALPASLLTDATAFIPPAVASLAARNTFDILSRTRPPLNLVISNVPGPRSSLYCAGAELTVELPAVGDRRRRRAQHHGRLLQEPRGLRHRRRPRADRRRVGVPGGRRARPPRARAHQEQRLNFAPATAHCVVRTGSLRERILNTCCLRAPAGW